MGKAHFCFGASFFILATSGTLLLTWTCWWMAIVGPSVPARRPFYQPPDEVPALIREASQFSSNAIFVYSLVGGWPTSNSVLRLLASLVAVCAAFSFALIATRVSHRNARKVFVPFLLLLSILALIAAILDAVAISRTARECSDNDCVTAVPDVVLSSGNVCICSVDGWFYLTLAADLILFSASTICFVFTVRPRWAALAAYPT